MQANDEGREVTAYVMTGPGVGSVTRISRNQLPELPLHVQVEFSDLNYKDALAVTGTAPILRKYPMVPGIDIVGTVLCDASGTFQPGHRVLAVGFEIGESYWGGFASEAHIRAEGVLKLPPGLDPRSAMAFGTAGITAALAALAIADRGIARGSKVLVTGATGGVGSIAVMLLSSLGYHVLASTGRRQFADYLLGLGAHEIVDRSELERDGKPLESRRWDAVVESVGGRTLVGALRSLADGGVVAACGMASSPEFAGSVYPFILRGAQLVGIHYYRPPAEERMRAWNLLAEGIDRKVLESVTREITLDGLTAAAEAMLANQSLGRTIVRPVSE